MVQMESFLDRSAPNAATVRNNFEDKKAKILKAMQSKMPAMNPNMPGGQAITPTL